MLKLELFIYLLDLYAALPNKDSVRLTAREGIIHETGECQENKTTLMGAGIST